MIYLISVKLVHCAMVACELKINLSKLEHVNARNRILSTVLHRTMILFRYGLLYKLTKFYSSENDSIRFMQAVNR